jgi:hypothetical protein
MGNSIASMEYRVEVTGTTLSASPLQADPCMKLAISSKSIYHSELRDQISLDSSF